MKISKTKLHQIIKEELQVILREQEVAGEATTMPSAVASVIKREQDLPHAPTYRERAAKVYEEYFGTYGPDALERMTHTDPELDEIISKLAGWSTEDRILPSGRKWRIHDLFPYDTQPSPTFVEVGLEFLKAGKDILDNESEFLNRVEKKVYAVGLRDFATTGAGSEQDLTQIQSQLSAAQIHAAETFAVDKIIKILKNKQPEKHGNLPLLQNATIPQVRELMDGIPPDGTRTI